MTRHFWVLVHRYAGLAMAGFLVIVGLTGSVLAFKDELDFWLNPDLLRVTPRDAAMLDPLALRERAEAEDPAMRVDATSLQIAPGRSYEAWLAPRIKPPPIKEAVSLPSFLTQLTDRPLAVYLDPYTGEKIGARRWGDVSLERRNIVSFLHRLHMTLALPAQTAGVGAFVLGVIALLWTVDCFVSLYLTLPLRFVVAKGVNRESWLSRWKPAWLIKWNGGAYRINFDLHRAFGLWAWLMLFVFAWSSVAFNLEEIYTPVMNTLFGAPLPEPQAAATPTRATPLESPKLEWREARARGRILLGEKARKDGSTIKHETLLALDLDAGRYTICANTLTRMEESPTCVNFDADTGEQAPQAAPAGQEAKKPLSETITWWVTTLHMARIFGLPMKIFVCVMGLVITALSVTGVVIWLKKRSARKFQARREALRHCATQGVAVE